MSDGELAAIDPPMVLPAKAGMDENTCQVWPPSVEYPDSSFPHQSAMPTMNDGLEDA